MKEYFKILNYFIENPNKEVYLRELARILTLSPSVTKKYLDQLSNNKILKGKKIANSKFFSANVDDLEYKYLKIANNLKNLKSIQLIDKIINKKQQTVSIILYGSYANGTNTQKSDIDILFIGSKEKIETELNMEIEIKSFTYAEWKKEHVINKAYYNDIINEGIVLYGEMPIL